MYMLVQQQSSYSSSRQSPNSSMRHHFLFILHILTPFTNSAIDILDKTFNLCDTCMKKNNNFYSPIPRTKRTFILLSLNSSSILFECAFSSLSSLDLPRFFSIDWLFAYAIIFRSSVLVDFFSWWRGWGEILGGLLFCCLIWMGEDLSGGMFKHAGCCCWMLLTRRVVGGEEKCKYTQASIVIYSSICFGQIAHI